MTTTTPFTPVVTSGAIPFSFVAQLDGSAYNVIVSYNVWGQRWYISVFSLDGTFIFMLPLIGSPDPQPLVSLSWGPAEAAGSAAGSATGSAAGTIAFGPLNTAFGSASAPLNLPVGAVADFTITGALPVGYNGAHTCAITGEQTFTYPLDADPGIATVVGFLEYDVSMTAGYFGSTLVFRSMRNLFEVSP